LLAAVVLYTLEGAALAQTNYQQLAFFGSVQGLGVNPRAALAMGTNGPLYGISTAGTDADFGGVFSLNLNGTGHALLRSFGSDTNGDTSQSIAGLMLGVNGVLYGVTEGGGNFGIGSVFKLDTVNRSLQVLHSFGSVANDGNNLVAALVLGKDGALYGTTPDGGAYRSGIVFKLTTIGTAYQILHQFGVTYNDAAVPIAPLIAGHDGALYGTTADGGNSNAFAGTVFKLNTDGSGYAVLHSFSFGEGYNPRTALIQGTDGGLYGTTSYGGNYDAGVVYRLAPDGSNYRELYSFPTTDGANTGSILAPSALVQGLDGALYGTTAYGGITNASATNGFGTVFKLSTNGLDYTVLHTFSGEDGRNPQAGVVSGNDGALYGTTPNGGYLDAGVVFKLAFAPPSQVVPIDTQVGATSAQLTYSGAPGRSWSVQVTTSLAPPANWQTLGSATTDKTGLFKFVDTGVAGHPARFYRASNP
jgi:uncharacterized repeat protein (TIGR03803 family)